MCNAYQEQIDQIFKCDKLRIKTIKSFFLQLQKRTTVNANNT